ncbi:pectin lyase-like protein [Wilcoxina mikolae CBS 423.85]|nr:pectin lyase-like protein [Wilcoxina mikolae CBS 423.85]
MTGILSTLAVAATIFTAGVSAAATTIFPYAASSTTLPSPIVVSGICDGGMIRFNGNRVHSPATVCVLILHADAIIGSAQTEGVHCLGSCTIRNVWFEDVCEDAITILQASGTSYIIGGGARDTEDKVIHHNGGGTVSVTDFFVANFSKFYRSCDQATIRNTCTSGVKNICQRYMGNTSGNEPKLMGTGNDRYHCIYDSTVKRASTCI